MLAQTASLAVSGLPAMLATGLAAVIAFPVLVCFPTMIREAARRRHRLPKAVAYGPRNARRAVQDRLALSFGHVNMRSRGRSLV
jgi:hypothetical protein